MLSDEDFSLLDAELKRDGISNSVASHHPVARKLHDYKPLSPTWHLRNAAMFLAPEALADEPALIQTKWHEYRGLCPQRANVAFAEAYNENLRWAYVRQIDRDTAGKIKGLDVQLIEWPKAHSGNKAKGGFLTTVHRLRQTADRLGLDYGHFVSFCLDFASRRPKSNFLPAVNQLVPGEDARLQTFVAALGKHAADLRAALNVGPPLDPTARPGCLGVPGAIGAACGACVWRDKCSAAAQIITQDLINLEQSTGVPQLFASKERATKARRAAHMRDRRATVKQNQTKEPTP